MTPQATADLGVASAALDPRSDLLTLGQRQHVRPPGPLSYHHDSFLGDPPPTCSTTPSRPRGLLVRGARATAISAGHTTDLGILSAHRHPLNQELSRAPPDPNAAYRHGSRPDWVSGWS